MEKGQVEPEPETDNGGPEKPEETLEERNLRVLGELEGRVDESESTAAAATTEEIKESLSTRDRLLRRVRLRVFETPIDVLNKDDEIVDEIKIRTRMLTSSERARAVLLIGELDEQQDESKRDIYKYNTTLEEMSKILAEVSMEEDVRTYFSAGEATDDIIVAVLSNTVEQSLTAVGDDISRFRQKRDRTSPP